MKKNKKGQQEELVTNKTQEEYNIFKTKDIKDIKNCQKVAMLSLVVDLVNICITIWTKQYTPH